MHKERCCGRRIKKHSPEIPWKCLTMSLHYVSEHFILPNYATKAEKVPSLQIQPHCKGRNANAPLQCFITIHGLTST